MERKNYSKELAELDLQMKISKETSRKIKHNLLDLLQLIHKLTSITVFNELT
jgi:hypothetical protein